MGASTSAERLQIPLHAQAAPFLALDGGRAAQVLTSLTVRIPCFSSTYQVRDTTTRQLDFEFKTKCFTSRFTLHSADGAVIASVKSRMFSSGYRVYQGAEKDKELFSCEVKHRFSTMVIVAEFNDRLSGDLCRVVLHGSIYDRVVLFYLERSASRTLPPFDKHDDFPALRSRYQPIGRVRRPATGMLSDEPYHIEAAPGVDVTLLLLLWKVRHQIEVNRRQNASS